MESEMRIVRLKQVVRPPRMGFGAVSETYIGATTEHKPVAIPDMTRPAYRVSCCKIRKHNWVLYHCLLTDVCNQLECTANEEYSSSNDQSPFSTKSIRRGIRHERARDSACLQCRDNICRKSWSLICVRASCREPKGLFE